MKFVILGVMFLLLIGYFFLVWKASQNWRWYQIVPVCLTMILALIFLFPTAGVLKSRAAWHEVKEKLEVQAAQVKNENQELKYGDATGNVGVYDLTQQLAKLAIEAGRSWRDLRMVNGNSDSITLAPMPDPNEVAGIPGEPTADPAADEEPPQPLVPKGLVVYGFAERINPETQIAVPVFYLGEFVVTASQPDQLTIVPTVPLSPQQKTAIDNQQAKLWSIYELLPLDGHSPFIAEGSLPTDDNVLGRVDDALVKRILGGKVAPETLKSYLEDGRRSTPDDPPLSRWVKVEFLKDYSEQVDSPDQRGALEGSFFDESGRSVDARLQRGENGEVRFKKGDQLLVQELAANQLEDDNVVRLLDRYYLRPLNDYRFILRHLDLRLSELANRSKELQEQAVILQDAIDRSANMLVANNERKIKLEQDRAQFRTETSALRSFTDQVKQDLAAMKKDMARLHRQNIALEQRLDELHNKVEVQNASFASVQ